MNDEQTQEKGALEADEANANKAAAEEATSANDEEVQEKGALEADEANANKAAAEEAE